MASKQCFLLSMTTGTFTSSSEMLERREYFDGIVLGGSRDEVFFVAGGEYHNSTEFVESGRKSRLGPYMPYSVKSHCFK